jgi:hypothetical protein
MNQFGSVKPGSSQVCAQCEALLMDVLDRTASPQDQAFFDKHLATCTGCSRMFIEAKRGSEWLDMLRHPRPEPSAGLFEKIIAQTSGIPAASTAPEISAAAASIVPILPAAPAPSSLLYGRPATPIPQYPVPGSNVLQFRLRHAMHSVRQTMFQPRLAMTAAMAFFSIALTLNLTGVHLSQLSAEDLKPSSIRRSFHEANAHVVRYCDNLRVVYELEARAHDLQRTDSDAATPQPAPPPQPAQPAPQRHDQPPNPDGKSDKPALKKPGPGTSRREPLAPSPRPLTLALLNRFNTRHSDNVSSVSLLPYHPGVLSPAPHLKGDLA